MIPSKKNQIRPGAGSVAQWMIFAMAVLAFNVRCTRQVRRDPEASAKRLAVGQDYYTKQMVAPALVEIQKALDIDPENAEAYYMLGVVKMGQAVEHIEIAERSTCLRGAASQVERAEEMTRLAEADENLKKAVRYRPVYGEAYDALAVVATARKDYGSAILYEQKARENPVFAENVIAKGNLGWAYYGSKDLIRAEKELREAVSKAPKFCVGLYRLGQVLFDQGGYEQAADELKKAADLKCPIQEAYRTLGLANHRLKRQEEASTAFSTCSQLAPKSCVAQECRKYLAIVENAMN